MEQPPNVSGVLADRLVAADVPVEIDRWIDQWVVVTDDPLTLAKLPELWAHFRQHINLSPADYAHWREWLIIALVTRGAIPFCSRVMMFQWLSLRVSPRVAIGALKDESI